MLKHRVLSEIVAQMVKSVYIEVFEHFFLLANLVITPLTKKGLKAVEFVCW